MLYCLILYTTINETQVEKNLEDKIRHYHFIAIIFG